MSNLFTNLYYAEDPSISKYSMFFKSIKSSYTLGKKQNYIDKFDLFKRTCIDFPWRQDQQYIIDSITNDDANSKYNVINGIFGCGKTTMLFGMMIKFIITNRYMPDEIMFISFNVCIKNEIKQKLKPYGFRGKVRVSTFDSIVYHICKRLGYKYLDLPNFDGKRRFCYEQCLDNIATPEENQPKLIFIDEVQDLEKNCFFFFKYFFPESKIVFAGDVFQSIQKEPRESLLWSLLNNVEDNVAKFYMNITPRVPMNILSSLQHTLSDYYPEFSHEIACWKSDNTTSEAKVTWNRINSYKQIYSTAREKVDMYGESNTMILTFSSAITVKGSLGDVARMRMELLNDYDMNKDHKKIEHDKLFLSTANSSKGLERDHVIVFMTFPLELAFSNFSNDIVVNLITVAITRAKKTVDFYVPSYEDKFTSVLSYFTDCPSPNKKRIRPGKSLKDYTFSDYIDMTRCVTELIRQSILIYDTRTEIKEHIKPYNFSKCFDGVIQTKRPIMLCEEERALVGLIIENLITSTWSQKWPYMGSIEELRNHPMYIHIFHKLDSAYKRYNDFIRKNVLNDGSQFYGILLYSQLHLAVYNKLFISFPAESLKRLEDYWDALKPKVNEFKPEHKKLSIQSNLQMPLLTGIADAIFEEEKNLNLWEIKASIDIEWKDNALTQAFLYVLCTGKMYSSITLINPFRNEKISYNFNAENIMTLRNKVYKDILTWNFNCYLAKNYNIKNKLTLQTENMYFAYLNYSEKVCVCCKNKAKFNILECNHRVCCKCIKTCKTCPICKKAISKYTSPEPIQLTVMEMLSPTKSFVKSNIYFNTTLLGQEFSKIEKLSRESTNEYSNDWVDKYKKNIWLINGVHKNCNNILELLPDLTNDYQNLLKYMPSENNNYELNFEDGLTKCICTIALLSQKYKFV
jgi:hypothetical protein